ncbi:hypothetical protein PISMIDRAFT_15603 [Pisolithus microcarpus 441]|uniref:Uncharacterized protein n=1 Tax=Pisolithus microcarpus 441 TaxID=765257 RepID=A0A0C9Z9Y0_9AGAM|nr:hypothetical protein PISMIDRAFT_15603 [Pisolithus microcarpus 441]
MSFDPFEEQMYASISTLPSEGQGTDQCQGEPARHTSIQGSHSDTMTPAQAYAYAVRTGQDYNHTLHYTIERKQPLRNPPAQPPQLPLSSVNTGAERGGLYAQRLYASATSSRSSSSLLSSNSPCVSTQPIDRPSPVAPSVPESRPLSRSQHHHRSSSRSPSAFDPSVPRAATQGFNVADLYHSSLPRGDLQSLRVHRSGPASLAAVGSRAEPAPLSAPPLHAPTPLVAYPRFQASVSQTQLPQRTQPFGPRHQSECRQLSVITSRNDKSASLIRHSRTYGLYNDTSTVYDTAV